MLARQRKTDLERVAQTRGLSVEQLLDDLSHSFASSGQTTLRDALSKGEGTFGQRCRAITREVFLSVLSVAKRLFAGGYSCEQVAEVLMPV